MERNRNRDARDGRDALSIEGIETFHVLYRKVRHCSSRASLEGYEQLLIPGLPANDGPSLKRCRRCWSVKPIGDFSCDRSRPDGLARQCRECDSDRHRQRRQENGDLYRVRARRQYDANPEVKRQAAAEFRRSDRGKILNLAAVRRYRERNAMKIAAHAAVKRALAAGDLVKPDACQLSHVGNCSGRIEAHHDDYTKPLEVRWLCTAHHQASHTKPRTYDDPEPNLFTVSRQEPATMSPDFDRAFRRWPRLRYVVGTGRWALVSFCPPAERIELFETADQALKAREDFDGKACPSDQCRGQHRIVKLIDDAYG